MLGDYERIVAGDAGLWGAFCWSVIQPSMGADDLGARVGTRVVWSPSVELEQLVVEFVPGGELDSAAWVIPLDDATGLLEVNGIAGALPGTLASLAVGETRVVSFYWNELIQRSALSVAEGGQVQQYDLLDDDLELEDVPLLRPVVEQIRARRAGSSVAAAGLAGVELLSGVEFDGAVLSRAWPGIRFASPVEPPPVRPWQAEQDAFAQAYEAAAREQQIEAMVLIVEKIIAATGLAEEPAAQRLSGRIRRGEMSRQGDGDEIQLLSVRLHQQAPPLVRGKADIHNPAWRRTQAGTVLSDMLRPDLAEAIAPEAGDGVLYHARYALDDQWPAIYAAALRILTTETTHTER